MQKQAFSGSPLDTLDNLAYRQLPPYIAERESLTAFSAWVLIDRNTELLFAFLLKLLDTSLDISQLLVEHL